MSPEVPIIILILMIPLYFLSKRILKRMGMKGTVRHIMSIILAFSLSLVVYVVTAVIIILGISWYPDNDFDKVKWKDQPDSRYEMTEDIIESKILIGKTQEEIISILGKESMSKDGSQLSYYVGHVPGMFNIDPSYLEIYFENGKAVRVSQVEG